MKNKNNDSFLNEYGKVFFINSGVENNGLINLLRLKLAEFTLFA